MERVKRQRMRKREEERDKGNTTAINRRVKRIHGRRAIADVSGIFILRATDGKSRGLGFPRRRTQTS